MRSPRLVRGDHASSGRRRRRRTQSSARTPKSVSLGISSRISTKPRSISVARSSSLTGDNFVRLALISRIAQRSRIAVSRSSPASNDFARCASLSASLGGSTATAGSTLFGWLERVGGAGSSSKGDGSVSVEISGGSHNSRLNFICTHFFTFSPISTNRRMAGRFSSLVACLQTDGPLLLVGSHFERREISNVTVSECLGEAHC
jgi:hypothetical protein